MLHDLTEHATVAATNDQDLLWVRVRVHGQMRDHLLVRKLIALGALDDVIEDQHGAVVGRLEDQDVLVFALLMMQDLVHLKSHGLACQLVRPDDSRDGEDIRRACAGVRCDVHLSLTGPHVRDLPEPAICKSPAVSVVWLISCDINLF